MGMVGAGKGLGPRFPHLQVLDLRHADSRITNSGDILSMQSSLDDADLQQLMHLPASLESLQLGNSLHILGSGGELDTGAECFGEQSSK